MCGGGVVVGVRAVVGQGMGVEKGYIRRVEVEQSRRIGAPGRSQAERERFVWVVRRGCRWREGEAVEWPDVL